jgi:hypothetical protein
MLVLGFKLVIGVLVLNMFLESGYYIDVVLVVLQVIRNTLLGYFEVGA